MAHRLWLVPLTITVTAYVSAPDDRDAKTIENIAQDAVGLHSKTFGVMLELDNTKVGEAVESVMEPLEGVTYELPQLYQVPLSSEFIDALLDGQSTSKDQEDGEEVEAALRTGGWDK